MELQSNLATNIHILQFFEPQGEEACSVTLDVPDLGTLVGQVPGRELAHSCYSHPFTASTEGSL